MRKILLVILVLVAIDAHAVVKMLAIDGMGAPGNIWSEFVQPMQRKYPGQIVATYSQWQDWQKHVSESYDVVVGHSLGGDSAIRYCLAVKVQPKILFTLAARHQTDQSSISWWDWLWPVDSLQSFVAPNSVTHNFYTLGPLPSSQIQGAVENVNVTSLFIWHGDVPSAPEVHAAFDKFMASLKGNPGLSAGAGK